LHNPARLLERALPTDELDPALRLSGVFTTTAVPAVHVVRYGPAGAILVGGRNLEFENGARGGLVMLLAAPVPEITVQPVSQTAAPGATVTFSVTATGENLQYQWHRDGVRIVGATSSTLTLTNVGIDDVGAYTVRISNVYDHLVSAPATLGGINPAPVITAQPASAVRVFGGSADLLVTATGVGPLTYQWRKSGHPVAGANTASLSLPGLAAADAGFYDVIVADGLSAVISRGAEVQLVPAQYPNLLRPVTTFAPRFERTNASIHAVAVLDDGRFFAAGRVVAAGSHATHGVARFLADGSVDQSFQAPAWLGATRVGRILASPDGGAILAVDAPSLARPKGQRLVRLLATGEIDPAFATDAVFDGPVYALARQGDGRVLVGGEFTSLGSTAVSEVVRLEANGARDTAFALGGSLQGVISAIAVQPDGRLLIGGWNWSTSPILRRLETSGAVDPTFANPFS
jgi:uncharacterized delta-60 repeat protein